MLMRTAAASHPWPGYFLCVFRDNKKPRIDLGHGWLAAPAAIFGPTPGAVSIIRDIFRGYWTLATDLIVSKVLQEQERQLCRLSSVVVWTTHRIIKVSQYPRVEGNKVYICGLLRIGNVTPGTYLTLWSYVLVLWFAMFWITFTSIQFRTELFWGDGIKLHL